MYVSLQVSAVLAQIASPFLPETASKLRGMLNLKEENWSAIHSEMLAPNHQINKAELLFGKIEDEVVEAQLKKLADKKKAAEKPAELSIQKDFASFEDFQKMDIRIGTILEAKKVAKTKKLLEIKVDTGIDQRTVVSGIAEHYKPEDIIGKQVSVLINLAPRKIKGIESQGMILMAESQDGKLCFVSPTQEINSGAGVN